MTPIKMEDVVEYVLSLWPSTRAPLQGASLEDISKLEAAQGRPLPSSYRVFLARLGQGTHGAGWEHIDFRVDTILQFLERSRYARHVPRRYLLIGRDLTESTLEYFLDLETAPGGEPRVVRFTVLGIDEGFSEEEDVAPEATSLAELLFRDALLALRIEPLSSSALHACVNRHVAPDELPVREVISSLGLVLHPLSGPWAQGYECEEGVVEVRWLHGKGLQIITASEDKAWVSQIGKELRSRLPVVLL